MTSEPAPQPEPPAPAKPPAHRLEEGWLNWAGTTTCFGCILFVLLCTFVGAVTVGRWLWGKLLD